MIHMTAHACIATHEMIARDIEYDIAPLHLVLHHDIALLHVTLHRDIAQLHVTLHHEHYCM
jgi:hypothetical protein